MIINYVELLEDLKKLLELTLTIPQEGATREYIAESLSIKRQKYTIAIARSKRNKQKCTFHAMTNDTKVGLLRLDIGDTLIHKNTDRSIIQGSHLHIYKEGVELADAISFNVNNDNLIEQCLIFLKMFNVIDVNVDDIVCYDQSSFLC